MQSEYPLSVLIVVAPWPGPVEQNPEPTTPTGPPRPAAAAAATLSRYQGYIEQSVGYHRLLSPPSPLLFEPTESRATRRLASVASLPQIAIYL